jgi:hypothetical protein
MSTWNLQELRTLIKNVHGDEQLSKASSHISSVDWKLRFASYHSYTASNAFVSVFDTEEDEPVSVIKMVLSTGEEATKYHEAKFIYEANVIACAQAMHSVADIVSHVILDALNIDGLDENYLDLKTIQKHVSNVKLKEKIVRVLGLTSFRYLQDFVNTTKHVSLVESE